MRNKQLVYIVSATVVDSRSGEAITSTGFTMTGTGWNMFCRPAELSRVYAALTVQVLSGVEQHPSIALLSESEKEEMVNHIDEEMRRIKEYVE